jgi:hypothetical protein
MDENNSPFNEELLNQIRSYIKDNDALRASRSLRRVFFDYIRFHHDDEPVDFEDTLDDVENLIELLELIAVRDK